MLPAKRFALKRSGMWKKDKASSVLLTVKRPMARWGLLFFSLTLLPAFGSPARAQHVPLPPQEQEWVNNAIDRGVRYLKEKQQKNGTWATLNNSHSVGYAALAGLTLLECGVPTSDPLIQRTAHYLRTKRASLATTYELSLSILFLDRLGDPADKSMIQTYALRLVAGQTATGGWGYRCPLIGPHVQKELIIALRYLNPNPAIARNPAERPAIAGKPAEKPDIGRKPDEGPAIAGKPGILPDIAAKEKKPDDLGRAARKPGEPPLEDIAAIPNKPPLPDIGIRGDPGSPKDGNSKPGAAPSGPVVAPPDKKAEKKDSPKPLPEHNPKEAKHGEEPANGAKVGNAKAGPAEKVEKPYEIPERLRMLAVVQDPALHALVDPVGRRNEIFMSTTDNSNTQFAILALWTAQRYDIPLDRTLKLVVRRYLTSQNSNGTWSYHYGFGGVTQPRFSSAGAMTCVGLIGLAVGHGLDNTKPGPADKPVQDPRILNGFLALREMIDPPAGRMIDLPMTESLYYLWSLERVAVLYNLPRIGDRDWYRWGAEILVANQTRHGNWEGGNYPHSHPTIDTCLALLFLKRANLVKDLTAKLPFNPADLNKDLMQRLIVAPETTKPKPALKTLPAETAESAPQEEPVTTPLANETATEETQTVSPSEHSGRTKWIVLSFVVFLLLAGGSVYFVLAAMRRSREADSGKEAQKPKKLKGPKRKNKLREMASSPDAKT